MRVLILADAQFAQHERALIERVVVGLTIEGIDAQLILPKDRGLTAFQVGILGDPIWYADRGLMITRKIRAAQIARAIDSKFSDDEHAADIVHVMGGGAWGMGRELARILGAGLVLEVWRAGLKDAASNLNLGDEDNAMFLVPERAFEDDVRGTHAKASVRYVPWGANVPENPVDVFRENKVTSIILMGSGRQTQECIAAYEGVADAMSRREDLMLFANQEIVERAGLWARVKKNRLENRFTVIDRSEDRRDLLLRCDMLVYPETLHEERTLLLDAMGAGLVVVAGSDERIQAFTEDSGVMVVPRANANDWAEAVGSLLDSRELARSHATRVREFVRKHRRSATHIESLIDAYNDLTNTHPTE